MYFVIISKFKCEKKKSVLTYSRRAGKNPLNPVARASRSPGTWQSLIQWILLVVTIKFTCRGEKNILYITETGVQLQKTAVTSTGYNFCKRERERERERLYLIQRKLLGVRRWLLADVTMTGPPTPAPGFVVTNSSTLAEDVSCILVRRHTVVAIET